MATVRPLPKWKINVALLERDRQAAMMTISEIASEIGMSRTHVSWVFNERSSSVATVKRIAKLFKKNPERYLIKPTPPPDPSPEDL